MSHENARSTIINTLKSYSESMKDDNALIFLDSYHDGCSTERLLGCPIEILHQHGLSLFELGSERIPNAVNLRSTRRAALDREAPSGGLTIEMVADDMPHIVEGVVALLRAKGLSIQDIVHPVVEVERAAGGKMIAMHAPGCDKGRPESFVRVEVDTPADVGEDELADDILRLMSQLRLVCDDTERCRLLAEEARRTVTTGEGGAFLLWLSELHFTVVGACQILQVDGPEPEIGTRLGLLRIEENAQQVRALLSARTNDDATVLVAKLPIASPVGWLPSVDCVMAWDGAGEDRRAWAFLGHFTVAAHTLSPRAIPLLRTKVAQAIEALGFQPYGHNARAAVDILETTAHDELFASSVEEMRETVVRILETQDKQRVGLLVRGDRSGHFLFAQVLLPSSVYDSAAKEKVCQILSDVPGVTSVGEPVTTSRGALTCLHFQLAAPRLFLSEDDLEKLRRQIADALETWADRLRRTLSHQFEEEEALRLWRLFGHCFSAQYRDRYGVWAALPHINGLEGAARDGMAVQLTRGPTADGRLLRVAIFRRGNPVNLYEMLPVLEHMGGRIIDESSFEMAMTTEPSVWMHDIGIEIDHPIDEAQLGRLQGDFVELFTAIWHGRSESDGFNRLLFNAGLDNRRITVLRAYAKYLKQADGRLTESAIQRALTSYPVIARTLTDYFTLKFHPALVATNEPIAVSALEHTLAGLLDAVSGSEDDRILRRLLNAIGATLRTNAYQCDAGGQSKAYLSIKFDSRRIDDLPSPRPLTEIFVYSPRVEAIHLRGGMVARGGLRWSDRPDDFRTEVLGLMKAQTVKNSVIVPTGAKGGFVVKSRPADRQAWLTEGIACYKIFINGLLDLTDNLVAGRLTPPPSVVRYDGDDPYLVVAADKGTASLSDTANAVSLERGFWLGDAFASGGSQGYDHKAIGITSRGAWESVKRHFREQGRDIQREAFTAVGVGDMSGDVFGNGMLQSPQTRLVAVFNHEHIFIDPNPDVAASYGERARLFSLPRSSWSDYDAALLSEGGGIYARSAKSITVSPQAVAALGLSAARLRPEDLIRQILMAPVDLLFFGGIGTYVRANGESDAAVGDRANDALRVRAADLRCAVVAEGANLALTQSARIEFAQRGGRINIDAVDNSAGVDCSDHEVNIKILLAALIADGTLADAERNDLLRSMTDEVATAVLRDNYHQTASISITERGEADQFDRLVELVRKMEKDRHLDRALEGLPDDDEIDRRRALGQGLTRPEIAVLFAFAKDWLTDEVLASSLPDDPALVADLQSYFPTLLRQRFGQAIPSHRLAREILSRVEANEVASRIGVASVLHLSEQHGFAPASVVRAFLAVREIFGLPDYWHAVEALDGTVPADVQYRLIAATAAVTETAIHRLLQAEGENFLIGAAIDRYAPIVLAMGTALASANDVLDGRLTMRKAALVEDGVPAELADRLAQMEILPAIWDIRGILEAAPDISLADASQLYLLCGTRFGLEWLRATAQKLSVNSLWQRRAVAGLVEDLNNHQRKITASIASQNGGAGSDLIDEWVRRKEDHVEGVDKLITELMAAESCDLAMLVVANREIHAIVA
ncbi:MAG TPA: NAD-glutamate dehydrogenase domain-containing protein [Telmatospirillum sp.]|nr:NAD-glutamate dehydrogenase domain-containing protein [Telmatospirillum sp.]